jgi:hypothetical protein
MRFLLAFIAAVLVAVGGVFVVAGRMSGPTIEIRQPAKFVGASSPLEVTVSAPGANLKDLQIVLEQDGKQHPLFTLADQRGATMKQEGADRLLVTGTVGRQQVPALKSGAARIVASASRAVVYGIRTVESTASRDVQVRLERPRISIVSTHHYVNHGGSEMAVYRVTPSDVTSGVLVGDVEYPGYPATGANVDGIRISDPDLRIAFFALLHDQDLNTPIRLFARDEAGNSARADFDYRAFSKPFKRSRIELDDRFLDRVVHRHADRRCESWKGGLRR